MQIIKSLINRLNIFKRIKIVEERTAQLSNRINNQLELINDNDDDINHRIKALEEKTFGLILKHTDDGVLIGNRTCDRAEDRLQALENGNL
tara:strand:- start:846 stop:1118 length:273 start_codon:yes stop_codon:yes gene_type:complete